MKFFRVPLLIISLFILTGSFSYADKPDCNVPIQTVLRLQMSGVCQAQDWSITNQSDWCDFWDQTHALLFSIPPCLNINFGKYIVVVTALGQKRDGCWDVGIDCIEEDPNNNLTVHVKDIVPVPRCFCPMMIVCPVDAVKVNKPLGTGEFTHFTEIIRCGGKWK